MAKDTRKDVPQNRPGGPEPWTQRPTHLAREIVVRTAGRGALGGFAIPGGSSSRRASHVPGQSEVSRARCGRGRARNRPALGSAHSSLPIHQLARTLIGSTLRPAIPSTTPARMSRTCKMRA